MRLTKVEIKAVEVFEQMPINQKNLYAIATLGTGALVGGLVSATGGAYIANLVFTGSSARNYYCVALLVVGAVKGFLSASNYLDEIALGFKRARVFFDATNPSKPVEEKNRAIIEWNNSYRAADKSYRPAG